MDSGSDHNPVVTDFRFQCLIETTKREWKECLDITRLKDSNIAFQMCNKLEEQTKEIIKPEQTDTNGDGIWNSVKKVWTQVHKSTL